MTDRWPALMRIETAAAYCDMSPVQFDRQCPVQAVDQGWRGLRWKKADLDAWIAALPLRPESGAVDAKTAETPDTALHTPEERRKALIAGLS